LHQPSALGTLRGKTDIADLVNLLDIVELASADAIVDFVAGFYPEAKVSGRLHLGIRTLWRLRGELASEKPDAAPRYLGRGRPPP
jgi:hypothetical protein